MWRKAAIFLLLCPVAVVCAAGQQIPWYGPNVFPNGINASNYYPTTDQSGTLGASNLRFSQGYFWNNGIQVYASDDGAGNTSSSTLHCASGYCEWLGKSSGTGTLPQLTLTSNKIKFNADTTYSNNIILTTSGSQMLFQPATGSGISSYLGSSTNRWNYGYIQTLYPNTIAANISPDADNTRYIGSSTLRYAQAYFWNNGIQVYASDDGAGNTSSSTLHCASGYCEWLGKSSGTGTLPQLTLTSNKIKFNADTTYSNNIILTTSGSQMLFQPATGSGISSYLGSSTNRWNYGYIQTLYPNTIAANISPDADNTRYIGSSTLRYAQAYFWNNGIQVYASDDGAGNTSSSTLHCASGYCEWLGKSSGTGTLPQLTLTSNKIKFNADTTYSNNIILTTSGSQMLFQPATGSGISSYLGSSTNRWNYGYIQTLYPNTIAANISPDADNTRYIGSSTLRYAQAYFWNNGIQVYASDDGAGNTSSSTLHCASGYCEWLGKSSGTGTLPQLTLTSNKIKFNADTTYSNNIILTTSGSQMLFQPATGSGISSYLGSSSNPFNYGYIQNLTTSTSLTFPNGQTCTTSGCPWTSTFNPNSQGAFLSNASTPPQLIGNGDSIMAGTGTTATQYHYLNLIASSMGESLTNNAHGGDGVLRIATHALDATTIYVTGLTCTTYPVLTPVLSGGTWSSTTITYAGTGCSGTGTAHITGAGNTGYGSITLSPGAVTAVTITSAGGAMNGPSLPVQNNQVDVLNAAQNDAVIGASAVNNETYYRAMLAAALYRSQTDPQYAVSGFASKQYATSAVQTSGTWYPSPNFPQQGLITYSTGSLTFNNLTGTSLGIILGQYAGYSCSYSISVDGQAIAGPWTAGVQAAFTETNGNDSPSFAWSYAPYGVLIPAAESEHTVVVSVTSGNASGCDVVSVQGRGDTDYTGPQTYVMGTFNFYQQNRTAWAQYATNYMRMVVRQMKMAGDRK